MSEERKDWRVEKFGTSFAIFEGERRVAYFYGATEDWTEAEAKANAERALAAQHLKREQEPAPLLIDLATKWLREQAETQCFTNDFRPSHRDSLVKLLSEVAAQPPQELVSLREAAKYARKVAFGMAYRCGHPRGGCPNHCDLLWAAIHQLDKALAALTRGAVGK